MVIYSYTLYQPSPLLENHLTQKYRSLLPSQTRKNCFRNLHRNIDKIIKSKYSDARLMSYGSYPAGVSLDASDLDLALILDSKDETETAHEIARLLQQNGFKKPRVTTTKGKKTLFGTGAGFPIKYDMSLNNFDGPLVSSVVKTAALNQILARQLMILVKEFIAVQVLNSPKSGHLSSAAYCYLCIVVLQVVKVLPRFKKTDLKQFEDLLRDMPDTNTESGNIHLEASVSPNNPILSTLFYRFFRFFLYEHDFKVYAVSVTRSQFKKKADLGWPHFDQKQRVVERNLITIENPFKKENLAKSINSSGLKQIGSVFRTACDLLRSGSPMEQLFKFIDR